MTIIHFTVESPLPPATICDALTDFSERRPDIWPNLNPRFYQVHNVGETSADVTEGSSFLGGVWERDHYDWSTPGLVHITVVESNAFAPGSFWEYRVDGTEDGGSRVEATVHRVGKSLKGRIVAILLRFAGQRVFSADFQTALDTITSARSAAPDERAPTQQSKTLPG